MNDERIYLLRRLFSVLVAVTHYRDDALSYRLYRVRYKWKSRQYTRKYRTHWVDDYMINHIKNNAIDPLKYECDMSKYLKEYIKSDEYKNSIARANKHTHWKINHWISSHNL